MEFQRQRFLVNGFQKSATQLTVDFHRRTNNGICPLVPFVFHHVVPQITQVSQIRQTKDRQKNQGKKGSIIGQGLRPVSSIRLSHHSFSSSKGESAYGA